MARRVLRVQGMGQLRRRLRELPGTIRAGARDAIREEVAELAEDMRRHAPRGAPPTRPVTLVEGIQGEVSDDGLSGVVAATARHSTFVEYGTSDTRAQPFVAPAAERSRRRFADRVGDEVRESLEGLTR